MKLDTIGLFVKDLKAMVDFYVKHLGYKTDWDGNPEHGDLHDEETGFRLMMSSQAFIAELTGKAIPEAGLNLSIELISEPVTYPWGQRAFYFADPEGNLSEIFANG